MPSAREWFEDFTQDEWSWSGSVWVEFWHARIQVSLDKRISRQDFSAIDAPPSDRQFEILDAVLNYPGDFVSTLERALFDYYSERAYGSAAIYNTFGEEVTDRFAPALKSPAEIWKLIRHPYLSIPHLEDDANDVVFQIVMDCTWDAEHGVCAVVRDWKIPSDAVGEIGNFLDVFSG